MNRYEKEIKAIDDVMLGHVKAFEAIYQKEHDEDRKLTEDERLEVEEHVKAIEVLKKEKEEAQANLKTVQDVEDVGRKLGPSISNAPSVTSEPADRFAEALNKSLGETFIESKGYKDAINHYREQGGFRQGFSTGLVGLEGKGTFTESGGNVNQGGGGGVYAAPVPQVIPGEVGKLFQQLTVADLLLSGQATTSSVRYVVEGTATSGAAGVLEGGTKPESWVGFTPTDEPIKKIATILPVSEEMLQDAPAIQSYINGRLSLFVRIEEERQHLRGTSGGAEVQGLLTSRSVPVYAGGTAAGNKAAQLFKAANGLRGSAFLEPEWMIIHPGDWEDIRLLTDTAGQFFGGGPFQGPYGSGANLQASGQVNGNQDSLWGKPVYVTAAVGATKGTAIIGTRSSAQVWRRGGMSVEASNSHSNFFQLNLVAIRAEERLGLAVYRPTGYVEVRLS